MSTTVSQSLDKLIRLQEQAAAAYRELERIEKSVEQLAVEIDDAISEEEWTDEEFVHVEEIQETVHEVEVAGDLEDSLEAIRGLKEAKQHLKALKGKL